MIIYPSELKFHELGLINTVKNVKVDKNVHKNVVLRTCCFRNRFEFTKTLNFLDMEY